MNSKRNYLKQRLQMWKTIIISMMFVSMSVSRLVGICNQCLAGNNVACLNETHFSTCYQGSPTTTITKCPGNRFCTNDLLICRSTAEGYTPICYNEYCGECDITDGIFTCLNETTYGYCFGATIPLESTFRSCLSGYVCNFNSNEVCVTDDVNEPSCGIKMTTTTEISTIPTTSTDDDNTLITTTSAFTTTEQTSTSTTTETSTNLLPTTTTTTTEFIPTTQEITSTMPSTSTTTAMPHNATTICQEIAKTGYFEIGDPTCRQFVYCYLLSGQYLGWLYYCEFYFNDAKKKCQREKPPNCRAYNAQYNVNRHFKNN